jgi:hypothetical protein
MEEGKKSFIFLKKIHGCCHHYTLQACKILEENTLYCKRSKKDKLNKIWENH